MNLRKNPPLKYVLLCLILTWCVWSGCPDQKNLPLSRIELYPQLEEKLQQNLGEFDILHVDQALSKSRLFQHLLYMGTKEQFLQMAKNKECFLVSMAGYNAIRRKHPEQSALAATYVFMYSEWVFKGLLGDLEFFLVQYEEKADLQTCLDEINLHSNECEMDNLLVLVGVFERSGALSEWFEKNDKEMKQPWMALVLEGIYPKKHTKKPTKKMLDALRKCSQQPGYPRCIYLLLANRRDAEHVKILKKAFSDDEITDDSLVMILRRHRDLIPNTFNLDDLGMRKERKEYIERWLSPESGK